jgi:hypothetical protein
VAGVPATADQALDQWVGVRGPCTVVSCPRRGHHLHGVPWAAGQVQQGGQRGCSTAGRDPGGSLPPFQGTCVAVGAGAVGPFGSAANPARVAGQGTWSLHPAVGGVGEHSWAVAGAACRTPRACVADFRRSSSLRVRHPTGPVAVVVQGHEHQAAVAVPCSSWGKLRTAYTLTTERPCDTTRSVGVVPYPFHHHRNGPRRLLNRRTRLGRVSFLEKIQKMPCDSINEHSQCLTKYRHLKIGTDLTVYAFKKANDLFDLSFKLIGSNKQFFSFFFLHSINQNL